jgi:hypothetical protein
LPLASHAPTLNYYVSVNGTSFNIVTTFNSANLAFNRSVTQQSFSISTSFNNLTLGLGQGLLSLTQFDVSITPHVATLARNLAVDGDAFNLTPAYHAPTLNNSLSVNGTSFNLPTAFNSDSLAFNRSLNGQSFSLSTSFSNLTLGLGQWLLSLTQFDVSIAFHAATIARYTAANGTTFNLSLTSQGATLARDLEVNGNDFNLSLAYHAATLASLKSMNGNGFALPIAYQVATLTYTLPVDSHSFTLTLNFAAMELTLSGWLLNTAHFNLAISHTAPTLSRALAVAGTSFDVSLTDEPLDLIFSRALATSNYHLVTEFVGMVLSSEQEAELGLTAFDVPLTYDAPTFSFALPISGHVASLPPYFYPLIFDNGYPNLEFYIVPSGLLDPAYFPGQTLNALIMGWLTQASADMVGQSPVNRSLALQNYVYYRGFETIATRLALEPNSASAAGVSRTISTEQINHFKRLSQNYYDDYLRSLGQASRYRPATSAYVPQRLVF